MKAIPYTTVSVSSEMSGQDIYECLASNLDPPPVGILTSPPSKQFFGFASQYKFKIQHNNLRENSFLPVVSGQIVNEDSGCVIHLSARPTISVLITMLFWLGACTYGLLGALNANGYFWLGPVFMMLFGYFMMIFGFWSELPRSLEAFNSMLKKCN